MLDWLRGHGVDEVILSCGFLSDGVKRVLGDIYDGMRLRYVVEEEPLGTAGPVRLALDEGVLEERLLVLNGDVLTDIDLTAELAAARARPARGRRSRSTRSRTRRATASCPPTPTGAVEAFLEKAEGEAPTNRINAGAYVLERERGRGDPRGPRRSRSSARCSRRWSATGLYGYLAEGYWIDIGTPERYLEATWDLLAGRVELELPPRDETGSLVYEGCLRVGRARRPAERARRATARSAATRAIERSVLHDRVLRRRRRRRARERARRGRARGRAARAIEPGAIVGRRRGDRRRAR